MPVNGLASDGSPDGLKLKLRVVKGLSGTNDGRVIALPAASLSWRSSRRKKRRLRLGRTSVYSLSAGTTSASSPGLSAVALPRNSTAEARGAQAAAPLSAIQLASAAERLPGVAS